MNLNKIIGTPTSFMVEKPKRQILDLIFTEGAILLNDLSLFGVPISRAPLVGFKYKWSEDIELFRYEYAKTPYLTREAVANSVVKQTSNLSIVGFMPHHLLPGTDNKKGGGFVPTFIYGSLVTRLLDSYIAQGGTFSLVSKYGYIDGLVCTSVVVNDEQESWNFNFEKLNFALKTTEKKVADVLKRLGEAG